MSWSLDSDAINANAREIVSRLGREPLDVYRFLRTRFETENVAQDAVFQFMFRSFYRIDNAGLSDSFKQRYFELLQENRGTSQPDLRDLTLTLYDIPNRRGLKSLQFSFVTKLANTVNPKIPIYDAEVARMYGFSPPLWYKPPNKRVEELCQFHRHVRQDYERMIAEKTLQPALTELERMYGSAIEEISPIKRLDFLIWGAGKLQEA